MVQNYDNGILEILAVVDPCIVRPLLIKGLLDVNLDS